MKMEGSLSMTRSLQTAEFNGYEAGTSIVEKSVVLEHGSDGVWSLGRNGVLGVER